MERAAGLIREGDTGAMAGHGPRGPQLSGGGRTMDDTWRPTRQGRHRRETPWGLVVDDDPEVVSLVTDILTLDSYWVDTAAHGLAALAKLEEHPYDVIVSDLRMPGLHGLDLYRTVARRHPALGARMILMTGYDQSPETQRFLQQTGIPLLRKPFTVVEVRRVVQQVLTATRP